MIGQHRTILLVEDNPDDVVLTLRAFEKNDVVSSIVVAHDGQEALDILLLGNAGPGREPPPLPDVILLDLKLPKMDGLEVLRRLRADDRTKLVPVVVLTSSDEQQDLARSYRLGANSYIRKPEDSTQFAEAVGALGRYWFRLNRVPAEPTPA